MHERVGYVLHHRGLVRDDQDRLARISQPSQDVSHVRRGANIDVRERFIQQNDVRIVQHRARQRQPLPHALRILPDAALQLGIEPDPLHCAATNFVVADSVQPGEVAKVLHAAEFVVKQRRVSHVTDTVSDLAQRIRSQHFDSALAGLHQSGEDAQQSALAGSVIAQDYVQVLREKVVRSTS